MGTQDQDQGKQQSQGSQNRPSQQQGANQSHERRQGQDRRAQPDSRQQGGSSQGSSRQQEQQADRQRDCIIPFPHGVPNSTSRTGEGGVFTSPSIGSRKQGWRRRGRTQSL